MAAKKPRKAARRKPKKRAGRPVKKAKTRTKPKVKARTKPKVRPAADILDLPPFLPITDDNLPLPPFRSSQPPAMHWGSSDDSTPWMWHQNRNAALLATSGAVEPPAPLTASPLVTSSPAFGSPALHAEMIKQIEALEGAFVDLREQRRVGIGHNKPPEPIEPALPLSAKELGEILKAIAVLKKQPPVPTARSSKTKAALALLTMFAHATVAYVGKQADNFVTAATKKSGEEAVKYILIYQLLQKLADIANQWWQSLLQRTHPTGTVLFDGDILRSM
jgi:hypothetical protein